MFTKSKNLLLGLFVLLSIGGLFVATNQTKAEAVGNVCGISLSLTNAFDETANWKNAGTLHCLDKDWYLDIWSTARYDMGTPPGNILVFRSGSTDDADVMVVNKTNNDAEAVNSFCFQPKADVDAGQALLGRANDGINNKCGDLGDTANAKKDVGFCSIISYTDCDPSTSMADGIKTHFSKAEWEKVNKNVPFNDKFLEWALKSTSERAGIEKADEDCQKAAGALGFLLCPFFNSISGSIQNILGFTPNKDGDGYDINPESPLQSLLIVRPLQFSTGNTLKGANDNVVAIANAIYVLVFLVIIFMNFIDFGIDNYTIKRLLPRLVAAIIFTQFSYLVCSFAIDVGNSLGFAVPNIMTLGGTVINQEPIKIALFAVAGIGGGETGISILAGIGGFLLALLIMIGVLVALILALIYMVFRLFALYLLVIVAPLAIAASVLPLTNKYFRMWGTNLIKLNLMFPMVTGLLAISGIISSILIAEGCRGGTNTTCTYLSTELGLSIPPPQNASAPGGSDLLIVAGALMPVLALFLIPKCLKLSGELMAFTAGAVSAKLAGGSRERGSDALEKSRQEGQLARLGGAYNTKKGQLQYGAGKLMPVPIARKALKTAGAKSMAQGGQQKKAHADVIKNKIEGMDGDTLNKLIDTTKGRGKIGEAAKKEGTKRYTEAEEQQANRVRHNLPELPHLNSAMGKLSSSLNKAAKSGERTYTKSLDADTVNAQYRDRYGSDDEGHYTIDINVNPDPRYRDAANPGRGRTRVK